jgi:hypothetical protein
MKVLILLLLTTFSGCTNLSKNQYQDDWSLFSKLRAGIDDRDTVVSILGEPNEVLKDEKGTEHENWIYVRGGSQKIWLHFKKEILEAVSMDVWSGEPISDIFYFLRVTNGKWRVIQAPVELPHAMPVKCHLLDDANKIRAEVHGYTKTVEGVFKGFPTVSYTPKAAKPHYPDVDPSRCTWLMDLVKKIPGE